MRNTIRIVLAAVFMGCAALAPFAGAQQQAAKPPESAKTPLEQVIIVYKTHFDIGYSALARDVVHQYRTAMVDRVLDAIERDKDDPKEQQFVWTVSGWR